TSMEAPMQRINHDDLFDSHACTTFPNLTAIRTHKPVVVAWHNFGSNGDITPDTGSYRDWFNTRLFQESPGSRLSRLPDFCERSSHDDTASAFDFPVHPGFQCFGFA